VPPDNLEKQIVYMGTKKKWAELMLLCLLLFLLTLLPILMFEFVQHVIVSFSGSIYTATGCIIIFWSTLTIFLLFCFYQYLGAKRKQTIHLIIKPIFLTIKRKEERFFVVQARNGNTEMIPKFSLSMEPSSAILISQIRVSGHLESPTFTLITPI